MQPPSEQMSQIVKVIQGHRTTVNIFRQTLMCRYRAFLGGFRGAFATWEAKQAAMADEFNLLEASGIADSELAHSRILAWLLDRRLDRGTHAQGNLAFRLFLEELGPDLRADVSYSDEPFWVAREVVGNESRVDIEIAARKKFIIHIENKIWSSEGEDQTHREWADLEKRAVELGVSPERTHGVFLTLDGRLPANNNFRAVGWHRLIPVLERFAAQAQPPEVKLFVAHYAKAIRTLTRTKPAMEPIADEPPTV